MNYEKEINNLKIQLASLQSAFLNAQRNNVPVVEKTDESYHKIPQVDENTSGVAENQMGLLDVADLADENSTAIEDLGDLSDENSNAIEELAELIDDLEERVEALEEK